MKLSYLDLMTTDPSYNLAMEQYVFDCLPRDRMYFMLWQNDNAIIVGKYQNTISEINEEAVRERGIRVVRRLSGGGAVYHLSLIHISPRRRHSACSRECSDRGRASAASCGACLLYTSL